MSEETKKSEVRLSFDAMTDDELQKVLDSLDYLHTITFAVTESAIKAVAHETKLTFDEVQTMFLDVQSNDETGDPEQTALAFVNGLKARSRSIEYAAQNRKAKAVADSQMRYNRWATANPKLAANPLTNLPVMLSYGIITEELFKVMLSAAQDQLKAAQSVNSAAL